MVDFNTAKGPLQISENQFRKLDQLDGKQDGEISKDVFTLAKQVRENEQNIKQQANPLLDKINNILKNSVTNWLAPKAGKAEVDKECSYDCTIYRGDYGQRIDVDDKTREFCKKAVDYFLKNGSLEGFSSAKLGYRYDIEDINIEFEYCNYENDSQEIKNGIIQNNNKADGIKITLKASSYDNIEVTEISYSISDKNSVKNSDKPTSTCYSSYHLGHKVADDLIGYTNALENHEILNAFENLKNNKNLSAAEFIIGYTKNSNGGNGIVEQMASEWSNSYNYGHIRILTNRLLEEARVLGLKDDPNYIKLNTLLLKRKQLNDEHTLNYDVKSTPLRGLGVDWFDNIDDCCENLATTILARRNK